MSGLVLVGTVLGGAGPAGADGAFPDGMAVLLPAARPSEIILAATFGLIFSDDGGATWSYACETDSTRMGRLYTVGAPPEHRLHAVSDLGAPVSADGACTWKLGGGLLEGATVLDVFPDPTRSTHVLAVAKPAGDDAPPDAVFRSTDGGLSYDARLFEAPPLATITGVEIAATAPDTIYVSFYERPGIQPRLARTTDGGASWTTLNLETALGPAAQASIAAIDPVDAQTIYLRVLGPTTVTMEPYEALAISRDGGATWAVPVTITNGTLTAFLRRQGGDGAVLLTGAIGSTAVGFRSRDGGRTFADWPLTINPRGLGERGNALFVAADDIRDGYALGRSDDGGATWRPLLRFREITSVRPCVREACQYDCDFLAGLALFPPETCNPPVGGDNGSGSASGGCGCALAGPAASAASRARSAILSPLGAVSGVAGLSALGAVALRRGRGRGRRRRRRGAGC